ncbi:hypothetical protein IEQ34_006674 [Dendrobium chrysotoxum]|uniref:Uncharacterized protein n=1 Tax=Dendrobium chrysotoxum TaxID=161865 RepID=A0AAV7H7D1_DENCH|nr:hypothetical protein IEQ34_006674 [Dendrobium chrysotoxum]
MATLAISTTLTLSLLLLLLTLGAGQVNPGSYDISAEQGWDKFVKDAAKATGGTPINMDEFVTRVNNNMNKSRDEEPDPELLQELKNLNGRDGSTVSNPFASEMSSEPPAAVNNLAKAKMIGSSNGGSLAPASNAALNGAMPVQAVGGLLLLLLLPPVFSAYYVL